MNLDAEAVDEVIRLTLTADRMMHEYLLKAAAALRVGCDPQEVVQSLEETAATVADSISRLEEVLS